MSNPGQAPRLAYDWRTPPSATGAPPRLTVATCQFPVEPDPPANLGHILGLIRQAARSGADLAHFPECALSGYGTADWPSWDGFDWKGLDDALMAVRQAAHTIPPLMQGYAFLHGFAISLSNSCRPQQDFPSHWIERSGHKGGECRRDAAGLTINALADDAAQDAFFAMVRNFRRSASDGSLYAAHPQTDAPGSD